jgi:hypothetical protein
MAYVYTKKQKKQLKNIVKDLYRVADDNTSSEELRRIYELASDFDSELRDIFFQNLATNPNVPLDILTGYDLYRSSRFARNPILPLLLIENPQILHSGQWQHVLYTNEEIPQILLPFLLHHPDKHISEAAHLHISYAGEAGENWRDEAGKYIAKLLCKPQEAYFLKKYNLIPDWIEKHCNLSIGKPPIEKQKYKLLDPEEGNEDFTKKLRLQCGNYVKPICDYLKKTYDPHLLRIMRADSNERVRRVVALNPYTPIDVLWELSKENKMRVHLVKNPSSPDILIDFILEESPETLSSVAYHPYPSTSALEKAWKTYPSMTLRKHILARTNISPDIQKDAFFYITLYASGRDNSPFLNFIIGLHKNTIMAAGYQLGTYSWYNGLLLALIQSPKPENHKASMQHGNRFVRAAAREQWRLCTNQGASS